MARTIDWILSPTVVAAYSGRFTERTTAAHDDSQIII